jgi:hypothetical protein
MELCNKVLMRDELPLDNLARYETQDQAISIIYSPMTGKIVMSAGQEEMVIPLTKNDIDWDQVLMDMLEKSTSMRPEKETIKGESIDDINIMLDVDSRFSDMELICTQVVVHPDNAKELPSLEVHETDLCPKDKAYFLPSPMFLGVIATKQFPVEPIQVGMSVINSQYVLGVDLKAG